MEAKELGEFIAKTRKENQITQAELAKRLNVTDKAVSRWERGLGYPDINTLEPLADALGVSLTELMQCSKNMRENNDNEIIASIEIAKIQRKKALRRIIIGGIGCIIGVCTVLYAVHLFMTRSWSFVINQSDGPTAVFVEGRIGNLPPTIICILGVVILLCGIFTVIKSGNNDKLR